MKRKLFIVFAISILVGSTYILGYSTFFTVSSVEITGSQRPITTGIEKGQKLARIEPRAVSSKLENLDWVESAEISRNWISGKVIVHLTERTPIATFKNQLIDSSGSAFIAQAIPSKGLIDIQAADIEDATKAVNFLMELPSELKETVKVVKVRATGAMVLLTEEDSKRLEIRWGTNSENELKFKVFKALIQLPENAAIKRVDVSAPHAPIVK